MTVEPDEVGGKTGRSPAPKVLVIVVVVALVATFAIGLVSATLQN